MPELKPLPCPVCGSEVHIAGGDSWHNQNRFWIECTCGVCRLGDTERDECIERWNSLPRALMWGEEPPKVAGKYYQRFWFWDHWGEPDIITVDESYIGKIRRNDEVQWAGPIAPPGE